MNIRPLIGITMYFVPDRELGPGQRLRGVEGQDLLASTADYARGIDLAGGIPFLVPPTLRPESVPTTLSHLDGLLLAGGEDVAPTWYGRPNEAGLGPRVPERDTFEFRLLAEALRQGLPLLAICRGMQLVNVHFGGTLVQDLPASRGAIDHASRSAGTKWAGAHRVQPEPGSGLARLFPEKDGPLWVNSFHHQAVERVGEGLSVAARAEDGLVEALETPGGSLLAVQWHPEMMFEQAPAQLAPFRWLMERAERRNA